MHRHLKPLFLNCLANLSTDHSLKIIQVHNMVVLIESLQKLTISSKFTVHVHYTHYINISIQKAFKMPTAVA